MLLFFVCLFVFTKFKEPAFSVRVEEGVCQIIPVIFWDFERLIANALVQFLIRKKFKKGVQGCNLPVKILLSSFTVHYSCKDSE